MKKNLFFSSPPRSFSNMATLTKHCILRYESYVFVFWAFVFFLKNIGSMTSKFKPHSFPQKNTQKCSRERCFECQNGAQLALERLKISKIVEKNRFLSDLFFERFFYAVKTLAPEARVMPRRLNYQGRGSPGSMTKVMLDGNLTAWEIWPGSNTPLDRWSGEFSAGLPSRREIIKILCRVAMPPEPPLGGVTDN